jgi:hypothetical protein
MAARGGTSTIFIVAAAALRKILRFLPFVQTENFHAGVRTDRYLSFEWHWHAWIRGIFMAEDGAAHARPQSRTPWSSQ